MISCLEDINDEKSNCVEKKMNFDPTTFFCKNLDGHSKCESMEIIKLHLKLVFVKRSC